MEAVARLDEERHEYQLGVSLEGVFVPLVSVPSSQVEGHVATVKQLQPQPAEQPASAAF